jgi:hypothetical protein
MKTLYFSFGASRCFSKWSFRVPASHEYRLDVHANAYHNKVTLATHVSEYGLSSSVGQGDIDTPVEGCQSRMIAWFDGKVLISEISMEQNEASILVTNLQQLGLHIGGRISMSRASTATFRTGLKRV